MWDSRFKAKLVHEWMAPTWVVSQPFWNYAVYGWTKYLLTSISTFADVNCRRFWLWRFRFFCQRCWPKVKDHTVCYPHVYHGRHLFKELSNTALPLHTHHSATGTKHPSKLFTDSLCNHTWQFFVHHLLVLCGPSMLCNKTIKTRPLPDRCDLVAWVSSAN